jgi:hypothetical protein
MINKLQSLFPKANFSTFPPQDSTEHCFVFFDRSNEEWISIPKVDISGKELNILKTFLELIELQTPTISPHIKSWKEFLFLNGELPTYQGETIRFIQFQKFQM